MPESEPMTRRRKSTKADKKSRKKKATRSDTVHNSQSTSDVGGSSVAGGTYPDATAAAKADADVDVDVDVDADVDAELLLRRPPKRRAAPIGPPLGEHIEATAGSDQG
jgi:hypothetical protein